MDRERAREILACYRPGRDDPADPQFAEALEEARSDAALGRWLEQEAAMDAVLRDHLRGMPVPTDLPTKILAGYPRRPVVTAWWRRPVWQAFAVPLAIAAVVAGLWIARPPTFAAYRRHVAGLVRGEYEMGFKSSDFAAIRSYLATHGSPSDYALTPAMESLEAEGGSTLAWARRKISLVCLEAAGDRDLFLFVVARSALPDAPAAASPEFARVGDMMTVTWSVGDELYLLAAHGDEEFLRQYL